jgi:chromosome segregation ATPase
MGGDLVKRLRGWKAGTSDDSRRMVWEMSEAADRIEALERRCRDLEGEVAALKAERNEADEKCAVALEDCARWKREVKSATDIRVEAEARAERLREVLKPFANIKADDGDTFDGWNDEVVIRCEITVGELKRARKALEDDKQ